jgi:hypothetical protein
MTPDQQRTAIAKICGWTDIRRQRLYAGDQDLWGTKLIGGEKHRNRLPDYLNDLNACHEMEKVLTQDQMIDYSRHVGKLVTSHLPASRAAWMDFKLINATAAEKSKAFLRTLGLWTETPTQPQ